MRRDTNLPAFRLVLSRWPTGPTTFDIPTALPTDSPATTSPHILRARQLHRVDTMHQDDDKRMKTAQQRNKGDHDKEDLQGAADVQHSTVRLHRSPKNTNLCCSRLATDFHSKVMSPKVGPFRVIEVSPRTVTIDEDGILNTVSSNHVTLAPTRTTVQEKRNNANNGNKAELPTGAMHPIAHQNQVMHNIVNTKNSDCDEGNVDNDNDEYAKGLHKPAEAIQEYAAVRIVRHFGKGRNIKFVVWWYGYTAADDTAKLPENIPEHFISRHWRRMKKSITTQP